MLSACEFFRKKIRISFRIRSQIVCLVFLVSIGWNGFGLADFIWTAIILLVGALIGIWRMRHDKNIAYGLVLVWAYSGIVLKHLAVEGFNGRYPVVIAVAVACLILFVFFIGKIGFYSKSK